MPLTNLPLRPLAVLGMAVFVFAGLGLYAGLTTQPRAVVDSSHSALVVVCSTTQIADFARQVAGDRWQVRSILASGQDPHLYEVRPGDAMVVAQASLCLENGWHLEGGDWMRRLAQQAGKPIVACVEGVEPYRLTESDEEFEDPHAWFTITNASIYVDNIVQALIVADPRHAGEYRERARLYKQQLTVLDRWIRDQFESIPEDRRVLVTSHDAFNYFCREYGLRPAAPVGWSTTEEIGGGVTPERRAQVVASIRSLGVKSVFVETSVNPKMIRVIAEEAGVTIGGELYSDSMGAAGTSGETYIGMMRENVLKIVEGLR